MGRVEKSAKLILMRHGQSLWNQSNLFTGWVDIPLSMKGIEESIAGGEQIRHMPIDVVFTSTLVRAQMTASLALLRHASGKVPRFYHNRSEPSGGWYHICGEEALQKIFPVYTAWELNERMYGDLQGLNKAETAQRFGAEKVQYWRRSYEGCPPGGESLAMTVARSVPFFNREILPFLAKGNHVFVAAHGNSLRGIVMELECLSPQEVAHLEIATGEPMIYTYCQGQWIKEQ